MFQFLSEKQRLKEENKELLARIAEYDKSTARKQLEQCEMRQEVLAIVAAAGGEVEVTDESWDYAAFGQVTKCRDLWRRSTFYTAPGIKNAN